MILQCTVLYLMTANAFFLTESGISDTAYAGTLWLMACLPATRVIKQYITKNRSAPSRTIAISVSCFASVNIGQNQEIEEGTAG